MADLEADRSAESDTCYDEMLNKCENLTNNCKNNDCNQTCDKIDTIYHDQIDDLPQETPEVNQILEIQADSESHSDFHSENKQNVDENISQFNENDIYITATADGCYYVNASVFGIDVDLLVDTGAACTLLSKRIYDAIKGKKPKLSLSNKRLHTADGSLMEVFGSATCMLEMSGQVFKQQVIVSDLGDLPAILGMDFMVNNQVNLDLGKGYFSFGNMKINLFHKHKGLKCVKLQKDITIPSESAMICHAYVEGGVLHAHPNEVVLVEQTLNSDFNLNVLPCVVEGNDRTFSMVMANCLPEAISLKRGSVIGKMQCAKIYDNKSGLNSDLDPQQDHVEENSKICSSLKSDHDQTTNIAGENSDLPEHLSSLAKGCSDALSESEMKQVVSLIKDYSNIFMGPDGKLGCTNLTTHKIDTGDHPPIKQKQRRMPLKQEEIADTEVSKMLKEGVVEPGSGSWLSPYLIVTKKDGSHRFCVDMRKVNAATRKDVYPLPRIDDLLESLGGSSWFCTLDLASGYWQVKIAPEDREKTGFATKQGLFQFIVMAFGLCNAPATFVRLMDKALHGLIGQKCLVYLDDIIIFRKSFKETLENVSCVFQRLQESHLKLKPKKCTLFQKSVEFLGHTVSSEGVSTAPSKIEAVKTWEIPQNVADVRSFIGFASYYRKFIPAFSTLAMPLINLTRKKVKFKWDNNCQEAFDKLRKLLVSSPILAFPTTNDYFVLDTDASAESIGGVLSQIQNGEEKVIAYASKTLSKAQRNYCTTYRELLAIVVFMKHFQKPTYNSPKGLHYSPGDCKSSQEFSKEASTSYGSLPKRLINEITVEDFHKMPIMAEEEDPTPKKIRKLDSELASENDREFKPLTELLQERPKERKELCQYILKLTTLSLQLKTELEESKNELKKNWKTMNWRSSKTT